MSKKPTELRLLENACEIFAEKGFSNTTVADICSAADANIASVNYYFRNKKGLYKEVWRHASKISEAKYPSSCCDIMDPSECLRVYINNRVHSIFDKGPAGWFPRIINREMAEPSPMEDELFKELVVPRRDNLEKLIRKLLGPEATDKQIRTCTINVLSVYAFINIAKMPRKHLFGSDLPTSNQINEVVSQMQDFVSAAVKGTRVSIEKRKNK